MSRYLFKKILKININKYLKNNLININFNCNILINMMDNNLKKISKIIIKLLNKDNSYYYIYKNSYNLKKSI